MKKTVLLLLFVAVFGVSFSQLIEAYPTSQRYIFNTEYVNPNSAIITRLGFSRFNTVYDSNSLIVNRYDSVIFQNLIVYGIAIPLCNIYCFDYDDTNVLNYALRFYNNHGGGAFLFEKSIFSDTIRTIRYAGFRHRENIILGNFFKMPDYDTLCSLCSQPIYPSLEIYFDRPYLITDTFWIGVSLPNSGTSQLSILGRLHSGASKIFWGTITDETLRLNRVSLGANHWGGPFPIVAPPPCMPPYKLYVTS